MKTQIVKTPVAHDALPGGNRAILKLANGKTILLDSVPNGVLARQGNMLVKKNINGQVIYNAETAGTKGEVTYNTISTPNGGQYQVVLPDGSHVWLNAASSITFPTAFIGNNRKVQITGEAYFEVAKNPEMPFIVKAGREEIRVLGTHFNVMAYGDEKAWKTSLLEGSIELTGPQSKQILKPGNQAMLNEAGNIKLITDADVEADVAWKNGFFKFSDAGIESVMRQAARWYDVSVSYKGKLPTKQFNGTVPRNVKLTEFLSMFRYAGINFDIEGKHITVAN